MLIRSNIAELVTYFFQIIERYICPYAVIPNVGRALIYKLYLQRSCIKTAFNYLYAISIHHSVFPTSTNAYFSTEPPCRDRVNINR